MSPSAVNNEPGNGLDPDVKQADPGAPFHQSFLWPYLSPLTSLLLLLLS